MEKNYQALKEKLSNWIPVLTEVSDTVVNENISNYPIFVLSKEPLELGLSIALKVENSFDIRISTLEEFVAKQIFVQDKIEDFKQAYKGSDLYLCLAILDGEESEILFLPK
jgi:hypothetical protein